MTAVCPAPTVSNFPSPTSPPPAWRSTPHGACGDDPTLPNFGWRSRHGCAGQFRWLRCQRLAGQGRLRLADTGVLAAAASGHLPRSGTGRPGLASHAPAVLVVDGTFDGSDAWQLTPKQALDGGYSIRLPWFSPGTSTRPRRFRSAATVPFRSSWATAAPISTATLWACSSTWRWTGKPRPDGSRCCRGRLLPSVISPLNFKTRRPGAAISLPLPPMTPRPASCS